MNTSVLQRWRLLAVALTTACVFTSRPQLPIGEDAGADAGGTTYDVASDASVPPLSDAATLRDVIAPPDVATPDAPSFPDASADASPVVDVSSSDVGATDDCRFVAADAVDGGVPDGAVVRDGGYFANAHGEPCDPMATPTDGGAHDAGAETGDVPVDVAPNDGGFMDAAATDGASEGG